MHLYQRDMSLRKEKQNTLVVSSNLYDHIFDNFESLHLKGVTKVSYKSIIIPLKEKMNVLGHIQNIIFGISPFPDEHFAPEESTDKIKEFVIAKKALNSSGIPAENQLFLYPEIMKSILNEVRISARLQGLCKAWSINISIGERVRAADKYEDPEYYSKKNDSFPHLAKFYFIDLTDLHKAFMAPNEFQNTMNDPEYIFNGVRQIVEEGNQKIFDKLESIERRLNNKNANHSTNINESSGDMNQSDDFE
uniref:Uncharacterized protein n=1 Tax=Euplotes crassus TaxID=5936 RepID=A0A7S3NST9_EUPCR